MGIGIFIILSHTGVFGSQANQLVLTFALPVVRTLSWPFEGIGAAYTRIRHTDAVIAENRQLNERIIALELAHDKKDQLIAQFPHLTALHDVQEEYDYTLRMAHIVLRDNVEWLHTIVINKGERDGVMRNMAVVAADGLVGKVIEVGYAYARVVLITDRSFRAGARILGERSGGVLEGQGADKMVLNYLPRDAAVVSGDKVVTSGMGGIFPSGITIGTVQEIFIEEYGFYTYTTVAPAVDFARIETVGVILQRPRDVDVSLPEDL